MRVVVFAISFFACACVSNESQDYGQSCDKDQLWEVVNEKLFLDDDQNYLRRANYFIDRDLVVGIGSNPRFKLAKQSFGPALHAVHVSGVRSVKKVWVAADEDDLESYGVLLIATPLSDAALFDTVRFSRLGSVNGCTTYANKESWNVIGVFDFSYASLRAEEFAQQCLIRAIFTHIGIVSAATGEFDAVAVCTGNVCTDAPGVLFSSTFLGRSYARDKTLKAEFKENVGNELCVSD